MNSDDSPSSGHPRINRLAVPAFVLLLMAIAVLGLRPVGADTLLAQSLQTTGHFMFFGSLALLSAIVVTRWIPITRNRRWLQYAFGLVTSIGLGIGLEAAQKFIPNRSASWEDAAYDAIGALTFIVLLMVLHAFSRTGWRWRLMQCVGFAAFLGLLIYGAAPFATCAFDHWRRHTAMPVLIDFQEGWSKRFLTIDATTSIQATDPPVGWPPDQSNLVLCRIRPGEPYPGLAVQEPYPDWSGYRTFAFDLMPKTAMPAGLQIRIQDLDHNQDYYDRFNRSLKVEPGFQTFRIPIDAIRHGPRHRELDLTRMGNFKIFIIDPTTEVEFYVGHFRLE